MATSSLETRPAPRQNRFVLVSTRLNDRRRLEYRLKVYRTKLLSLNLREFASSRLLVGQTEGFTMTP